MGYTTQSQRGRTKMSIGSEYWRKEVESLQSQLQEKTEKLDEVARQIEELRKCLLEIPSASYTLEASDGKAVDPKGEVKGYKIYCENPATGEKILVKEFTKYDVLEAKYKAECEANNRLQQRVAKQKSENEVLHRKVNDLGHKYRQACRERDELAEKLRIAEGDDQKRSLLIEALNRFLDEVTKC